MMMMVEATPNQFLTPTAAAAAAAHSTSVNILIIVTVLKLGCWLG